MIASVNGDRKVSYTVKRGSILTRSNLHRNNLRGEKEPLGREGEKKKYKKAGREGESSLRKKKRTDGSREVAPGLYNEYSNGDRVALRAG